MNFTNFTKELGERILEDMMRQSDFHKNFVNTTPPPKKKNLLVRIIKRLKRIMKKLKR